MSDIPKNSDQFIKFLQRLSFVPFVILLLIITLPSMIYTVKAHEDAVVLRFGKYDRTVGPGLHFKLPWDLEKAVKIPVRKIQKMEFGFRTKRAGKRTVYSQRDFGDESIMLTGDLNLVDVSWSIQYKIKDAKDFLFNVRSVRDNLFDLSEAVMRKVIGDHTATESISDARDEIAQIAAKEMQEISDHYKMGVHLVAVELQDIFPPEEVKASFDEVNSAVQDAEQIANQAEKQGKKVLQVKSGEAEKLIRQAEAYKVDIVNRAKGDAKRFTSLYEEYKKAPTITKKRLYFDKMREVLGKSDRIFIVDPQVKGLVPLVNMNGGS